METLMKHITRLVVLAALLGVASPAYALHPNSLTRVQVFQNVSGSTITSYTAVVIDLSDAANAVGSSPNDSASTIGTLVNTTTSADSANFAGVLVDDQCVDDQLCRFAVEGPSLARWAGSTDDTDTDGTAIGTTTIAGELGAGNGAGYVLDATDATAALGAASQGYDNVLTWVWLQREPSK